MAQVILLINVHKGGNDGETMELMMVDLRPLLTSLGSFNPLYCKGQCFWQGVRYDMVGKYGD